MCAGWQFNGEGRAVSIPQARFDSEAGEATALRSKRSCAITYPTQVRACPGVHFVHDIELHLSAQSCAGATKKSALSATLNLHRSFGSRRSRQAIASVEALLVKPPHCHQQRCATCSAGASRADLGVGRVRS